MKTSTHNGAQYLFLIPKLQIVNSRPLCKWNNNE